MGLSALLSMAQNAEGYEDILVAVTVVMVVAFFNRIGETASIRVQDISQAEGTVSFFDSKNPSTMDISARQLVY